MKKINISVVVAIMIYSCLQSCSKEMNKPPDRLQSVTSSEWFSASWQQEGVSDYIKYVKYVPGLGEDLLKGGEVLVFGKGGFGKRYPASLPSSFDANYIAATIVIGGITFVLKGGGAISSSLQFRYILIPSNKLAGSNFNYNDYDAVCNYYNIQK